ncbi:hypothetical protein ACS0TY_027170 [Phlomoides rotata]
MAVSRLQGKLAKEGREPASAAFKRSRENILPEKVNQVRSPEKSRGRNQYFLLALHAIYFCFE